MVMVLVELAAVARLETLEPVWLEPQIQAVGAVLVQVHLLPQVGQAVLA
jgi:hypothetical protein